MPLASPLLTDTSKAKKQEEAIERKQEVTKNKLVLRTVDVPEHLKEILLLKVTKHQIAILHADMDSENDKMPKCAKNKVDAPWQRHMIATRRAIRG